LPFPQALAVSAFVIMISSSGTFLLRSCGHIPEADNVPMRGDGHRVIVWLETGCTPAVSLFQFIFTRAS
ncbi:MAG: hypothetical protein ACRCU5_14825, partial [Rhizobiaceae bacterium]